MDVDQLSAFENILREGSFSRAAERLDIAQPTISARIQALEHEVGGALFVRQGRKISLTERGEVFQSYAQRALAVIREGTEAAQRVEQGQFGSIRLATVGSLTSHILLDTISAYCRTYPNVQFAAEDTSCDEVIGMLNDGLALFGLLPWPYPSFSANALIPVLHFRERLILVAHPNHPLAAENQVTVQQIAACAKPYIRMWWSQASSKYLTSIETLCEESISAAPQIARSLVLNGIGAGFLNETLVDADLNAGHLVALDVKGFPALSRDSALLVHPQKMPLPQAAEHFVACMRQIAGERVVIKRM